MKVYKTTKGYYYKEYKSGKKVRIALLEYNLIKNFNDKVNKLKKQIKDDNLFYPEGLKYAEKYIKKYNKKDFSIGEITTFLYEDKTFKF